MNLVIGPNEQVDNALVSKKGDTSEALAFRRSLDSCRELQECGCMLANGVGCGGVVDLFKDDSKR